MEGDPDSYEIEAKFLAEEGAGRRRQAGTARRNSRSDLPESFELVPVERMIRFVRASKMADQHVELEFRQQVGIFDELVKFRRCQALARHACVDLKVGRQRSKTFAMSAGRRVPGVNFGEAV